MCGIVGYTSVEEKLNLSDFMKMVKSLDYRGYDSWGISYLSDKLVNNLLFDHCLPSSTSLAPKSI